MASPLRLYFVSGLLIITACFSGSCSSVDICSAEHCSASDQPCQFIWDNRAGMTEKIRDRLKHRPHKHFLRFKVPVYYLDAEGKQKQARDEFETWVSVADTHEYMLHFPHNFNVLSLGTMGIITDDFWGPDGKWDVSGYCNKACSKLMKPRCSLSRKDIQEFVANVTLKDKQDWNYICFQLDYDVNDVIRNPNTAIPDIFYYWRFLRQLFTKRPYLGKRISENDFVHYNCFDKEGQLHNKEFLRKYFIILIIAIILWLYSPLLVHYFPSSQPPAIDYPAALNHKDFCPTFRSPVYFVGLLRWLLCFHMEENKAIKPRIRRFLFLSFFVLVSFRLWYTSYRNYFVMFSVTFLVAALVPEFFSVYLKDALPTHFLGLDVLLLCSTVICLLMFYCYLLAEVTMFTYIGAVLVPTIAFKYVALVGSVSIVLYKIAKDLRENYDRVRDQIVKILENKEHLTRLNSDCTSTNPQAFERMENTNGALLTIQLKNGSQPPQVVLYRDHFATYLSRTLLDFCIEACDPLRRKMIFIFVEVFLMTFYLLIAIWTKNVFHKEKEVSNIFAIAQTIGTYFVPNFLQFLAHKSHFGKKDDVLLSQRVHDAIVTYVAKQKP